MDEAPEPIMAQRLSNRLSTGTLLDARYPESARYRS